jgi:SAM-dependent methyltransferase
MYGTKKTDPIVRYYDIAFGINGKIEFPWIQKQIKKHPGHILDLGGGTGRFSIEALRSGNRVTYVDASTGMIDILKEKLEEEIYDVAQLQIHQGKMHEYCESGRNFSLILCIDGFFHNLQISEQRSLLRNIRTMLGSEGVFIFNIPYPNPNFLAHANSDKGKEFSERGQYKLENGGLLTVYQKQEIDFLDQLLITSLKFIETDQFGNLKPEEFSEWTTRYTFLHEMEHLIELANLKIKEKYGYYTEKPIDADGQMIFILKK